MRPSTAGYRAEGYERALRIDRGQLVCPRRGVVDVERCWTCPDYRGLSSGRVEAMVCGASPDALASALWALERDPVLES